MKNKTSTQQKAGNGIKRIVSRSKTWQISKLNKKQKKDISMMIHHFLRHQGLRNQADYLTDEIMDIIRFGLT